MTWLYNGEALKVTRHSNNDGQNKNKGTIKRKHRFLRETPPASVRWLSPAVQHSDRIGKTASPRTTPAHECLPRRCNSCAPWQNCSPRRRRTKWTRFRMLRCKTQTIRTGRHCPRWTLEATPARCPDLASTKRGARVSPLDQSRTSTLPRTGCILRSTRGHWPLRP